MEQGLTSRTIKIKDNIQYLLSGLFPKRTDINFGIVLICSYIIMEFGSLSGLYSSLNYTLRLPLVIAVTTIGYAFYLVITRKVNLKTDFAKTFILMCLFIILYALLSTKLQVVREGLIKSWAYYLAAYIVLIESVKRMSQFILVIDVWLASILFTSFNAIMQGGLVWSNKYLRDENEFALLASIAFPWALIFLISHKSILKRFSYLMCIIIFSGAQIVAHSRGGMLSFATMLLCFWWMFENKVRNLIIISIIVVANLCFAPPIYFEEMATLHQGVHESTADSRIYFWEKGFEMFYDNPLFGVGPLNYPYYFPQYDNGERYTTPKMRPPHSFPIQWLAEMGIIGMIFLVYLQMMLFRNWQTCKIFKANMMSREDPKNVKVIINFTNAAVIAQIAFWTGAIFLSLFSYPFYWYLIFFSDALSRIIIELMNNYS